MSASDNAAYLAKYHSNPEFRAAVLSKRKLAYWANREERIAQIREWRANNPDKCKQHAMNRRGAKQLWNGARKRAIKNNLPFNIEVADIIVPEFCPALGIKLQHGVGTHHAASPTLDRVVPSLGYVKGNIAVISLKANVIKNNATQAEIQKVADWLLNFFSDSLPKLIP